MAQQLINLGTTANDGTGTNARDGGDIINDNFTEVYNDIANIKPVAISYTSSALMIAGQVNQKTGFIYYDGASYWEYLGTTVGDITDYKIFTNGIPIGGTTGQVLEKIDATDYNVQWADATGGTSTPQTESSFQAITINNATAGVLTEYPFNITLHRGFGYNTISSLYLKDKINDSWSNLKVSTGAGVSKPYFIDNITRDTATLYISDSLAVGDNIYLIEWGYNSKPNENLKIIATTDQHYDTAETYVGRDQALTRLDNFKERVLTFKPDIILEGGDKVGNVTTVEATRLGFMQDVTDKHDEAATSVSASNYLWGWGNHDFEHESFTAVRAQYSALTYIETGALYGSWESDGFTFISLDSNYAPGTQNHMSNQHQGFGYINTDQITWLTGVLAASTLPCIVMCHHPLAEHDTERIFLTKETYHTQNRANVRDVLEASGKVALVISGHTHTFMYNSINQINYIAIPDLNQPPATIQGWYTPINAEGQWSLFEINKTEKTICFSVENRVGNVDYLVFRRVLPYRVSGIDTSYSNAAERVFFNDYLSEYEKPGIVLDASDMYINDDLFMTIVSASHYDNDPMLSDKTIKFIGITADPDYGRATWNFRPESGDYKLSYHVNMSTQSTFYHKFNDGLNTCIYMVFHADGNIKTISAGAQILQTYNLDQWYHIEVYADQVAETYTVFIDGVQSGGTFAFNATGTALDNLEIVTETGVSFMDGLRIENYDPITPSITNSQISVL